MDSLVVVSLVLAVVSLGGIVLARRELQRRLTAEQRLAVSQRRYALAGVGMLILDARLEVLWASEAMAGITDGWPGVTDWWAVARQRCRLPEARSCPHCDDIELVGTMTTPDLIGEDGVRRAFELTFGGHAHDVSDASGQHVLLVRDATERKRHNERARIADRVASLGALAAGVAHEINNPLQVVLSNLEVLRTAIEEVGMDGDMVEGLQGARAGAGQMRQVVADLQALVQGADAEIGSVDVAEVLVAATRLVEHRIRERAALVVEVGLRNIPPARANRALLGQVLLDVFNTVERLLPRGGVATDHRVSISLRRQRHRIAVRFEVVGPLVPELDADALLDPSIVPEAATETMGLALGQRLVSTFGGRLTVASRPGRALIEVSLRPVLADDPLAQTTEA